MKKKVINAATCDARSVTEESLAGFDKITINAAIMIVGERSKELLVYDPSVKEEEFYEDEFNRTTHYILRSITCKHRKRCNNMINWLNKNYKEKGDNNGSFTD